VERAPSDELEGGLGLERVQARALNNKATMSHQPTAYPFIVSSTTIRARVPKLPLMHSLHILRVTPTMALARAAYGRSMDDRMLRERVEYMYIPPEQIMSANVETLTASFGLRLIARDALPGTSATQLKQRVSVFQKDDRGRG